MKTKTTVWSYIGNALLFNKGYRKAGFLFWLVIASVLAGTADYLSQEDAAKTPDYVVLCTQGDFDGARDVQDKYYATYSNEYAKWRGGQWNEREARMAQEITSIYYGDEESREERLIGCLMAIPTEGAPLAEGCYGNGMFYNNDAGVGNGIAIDHLIYQSWARFYNDRCEQLLDLALTDDNSDFAKKIATMFKAEVVTLFEQDTLLGDGYCIATVSYDTSRREAAIQRVN